MHLEGGITPHAHELQEPAQSRCAWTTSALLQPYCSSLHQGKPQNLPRRAQRPPSPPAQDEAGSCGQADNSCLYSALLSQKDEPCQPAGRQEQQRYQGCPLLIGLTLWCNNSAEHCKYSSPPFPPIHEHTPSAGDTAPASDASTPICPLSPVKLPTLVSSVVTSPAGMSSSEESLLELSDALLTGGAAGAFTPFPEGSVALALAATVLKTLVASMFGWDRL